MKLIEALTDEDNDMRVTCGDRWLVAKWTVAQGGIFTIYEHKKYQKYTRTIEETPSEDIAVDALKGAN